MKVMCIKQDVGGGYGDEIRPVIGQVYTVRTSRIIITNTDHICYILEEIRNTPREYQEGFGEFCFWRENFRPITDISSLQHLTKVRELEDVQ